MPKRIFKGKVIRNSSDKTVKVLVNRIYPHPKYKKFIISSRKFLAHDQENQFVVGDMIKIQESSRFSKRKAWVALEKIGGE